ncbi:uncharacterized protein LOC118513887 [Anopheles stephensi]|uniref:uncharacterized protein LOC118513887 n=1 Tax=Anopheles stephensi TaxID=30069 RepID=UPI001658B5BB|nr:uncharacterized protein LOC118513887 [Anopheles stephensi]
MFAGSASSRTWPGPAVTQVRVAIYVLHVFSLPWLLPVRVNAVRIQKRRDTPFSLTFSALEIWTKNCERTPRRRSSITDTPLTYVKQIVKLVQMQKWVNRVACRSPTSIHNK